MIKPGRPLAAISSPISWTPLITPHRLTSSTRFHGSSPEKASPPPPTPALFISTSTAPNFSTAASRRACTAARSATSVGTARALSPMASAAFFRARPMMSAMTTFMPSAAKAWAAARPMPSAAPVMTAVLPGPIAG